MKQKFVLIMVLIIQAMFLFSAEPIKIIEQEARKEVLNNRQYRFYEYKCYSNSSTGYDNYNVSMELEIDERTSIRLVAFIEPVGYPLLNIKFNYDYGQITNNFYFDSVEATEQLITIYNACNKWYNRGQYMHEKHLYFMQNPCTWSCCVQRKREYRPAGVYRLPHEIWW